MMKIVKRILACLAFCTITLLLITQANEILISKTYNRYYMLERAMEEADDTYDVQVFGACHSYTSFQAKYYEDTYGYSAYAMGNPGEIIPVTYLRMRERFQVDTPEVALVEIWGVNPYDTYSSPERCFEYYMPVNLELLPLSLAKLEVIHDFYSLDPVLENFAIAKYKDRLLNGELSSLDFHYSFAAVAEQTSAYTQEEMTMRLANNGFCVMPMWHDDPERYTPYRDVSDYAQRQPQVAADELLPLEEDILKYVDKIISLCEQYDVELIFYRAPYLSGANELRKANWLSSYCAQQEVLFLDLEKEMEFDLQTDFLDYEHLNETGAIKATDFLASYIEKAIK